MTNDIFETTTQTLLDMATRAREVLELRKVETAHAIAKVDKVPTDLSHEFQEPYGRNRAIDEAVRAYQLMLIAEQTCKRLNALTHPTLGPLEQEHDRDIVELWRKKLEQQT